MIHDMDEGSPNLGSYLVRSDAGKSNMIGKEQCMQLVLDTTGDKMNILEYLKTEMLEEKRAEKDGGGGSIVSLFDRDISLKIEVLEDGTARAVPDSVLHVDKSPKESHGLTSRSRNVKRVKESKIVRPKNYACTHCGTAFVSTKDLARHTVVHTGEKPYSCPYCDQKFTAPSSRATHIRSIHEKSQEFLCPECEKPFNQKSNMVKHYKTIHLETVVIICQECGRDFNQASALRRHIKIVHKKELPHSCSQCDKKFALAESLKKHMEAIHLKSRAYPCTYCDYAASRADMLKIHIRKIHTKEWKYKCGVCEAKGTPWGCILPKELRRHLQTRHPEEYSMQTDQNSQEGDTRLEKVARVSGGLDQDRSPEEESGPGSVEERAAELLEQIKHPLEFTVQLEAEVRAKACRAPPNVLASARVEEEQEEKTVIYTEEVLLAPAEQGWEYQEEAASLYTEEDHWQGSQTVVVQDRDGASSQIRLLYDFPR